MTAYLSCFLDSLTSLDKEENKERLLWLEAEGHQDRVQKAIGKRARSR
jgi:hypothetical protein